MPFTCERAILLVKAIGISDGILIIFKSGPVVIFFLFGEKLIRTLK